MTVEMINAKETNEENKIKWENVALPRWNELCQWCRLLYQGIVPLRIGVVDGQHRMCAIVKILTGWDVILDEALIPPKRFHWSPLEHKEQETFFRDWLEISKTMPTVRTLVAKDCKTMEREAQQYSTERETSQREKKQRNLVDV
jgi:hypothetical protein